MSRVNKPFFYNIQSWRFLEASCLPNPKKHIIAPRVVAAVPIKKVAGGPHALQTNPPKEAPAIIPVFSHTPPYTPIVVLCRCSGTESDTSPSAAGLNIVKPKLLTITNKISQE